MATTSLLTIHPIHWLGYSPENADFDAWLTKHRIYERPHDVEDDDAFADDYYTAKQGAENSQIERAEHLGVCLIYVQKENYERLFGAPEADGAFVLKELVFYARGVQGYQGYTHWPLPFNLQFGMQSQQVRRVLGEHCGRRFLHDSYCERFVAASKFIVNVTYIDDIVNIIHVRTAHIYDQKSLPVQGYKNVALPTPKFQIAQLLPFLGGDAMDASLDEFTRKLGWSSKDVDLSDWHESMELIEPAGLALYYRQAKEIRKFVPQGKLATLPQTVFVGFRVNRCGDMDSEGYSGAMPYDLEFYDSPSKIIEKIGQKPLKESLAEDTGYYMWSLKEGVIHAMFSLIDLQLYRLTIYAPFMAHELKI